jgi:hypothetical protein
MNMKQDIYSTFDNNFTFSPSLNQGLLFNSKQQQPQTTGIIKIDEEDSDSLVEGFVSDLESAGKESTTVLDETQPTQREIDELVALKTQYNHIVDTYNSLQIESIQNASNYINRTNAATNPYAGKNILVNSLSSNQPVTGYVTQMGVFKPYPQDNGVTYNNTAGKSSCPMNGEKLNMSSSTLYDTGSYLKTDPNLLVGTVMKSGQSCGNEGQNVHVNNVISDTQDQYLNCFDSSLKVTPLNGKFDFTACKQAAIDSGYQHFALREVNKDGIGSCVVSNDMQSVMNAPPAYYYVKMELWSLNSAGSGTGSGLSYAAIGPNGSLSVANFGDGSKNETYATPIAKDQMSNYIGCYVDTPQRSIPMLNNAANEYTYTSCMKEAQKQGKKYFGLQYLQPSGLAQCGVTDDIVSARKFGIANNCVSQTQNNMPVVYGGGWSNSVYSVQGYSFYFLILQDDGNMCIYRGSGPQDNQGLIWSSNTAGKQKDANPKYAAAKGKNGRSWIVSPDSVSPDVNNKESFGDFIKSLMNSIITSKDEIKWIGSTDGSIYLMMEQDGNLTLNTSVKKDACIKIKNNMVSETDANAIHTLFDKGYPENVGKLGYVDENAELWEYPISMIKQGSSYETIDGYRYASGGIMHGYIENSTVDRCKDECNRSNICSGFVYEKSTNNCGLKSNIPYLKVDMTPDKGYSIYRRTPVPDSPLTDVKNITSVQWQNYNKSGKMMTPEKNIYNVDFKNQEKLKDIGKKLQELLKTIDEKTINLEKRHLSQHQQMVLNNISMKSLVDSFNTVSEKIYVDQTGREKNKKEGFINMNRVLEESKLIVNQEELTYAMWTCLAILVGVVFIKALKF